MNVLLLPTADIKNDTAIIKNPLQINHIKTILKSQTNDWLKIGEWGGCLGVGQIEQIFDEQVILKNVALTTPPPPKLDLTVILALPRPKVARRLIMDMTAFGVAKIVLINSVATEKSYWQSPLITDEKLASYVLEGLQQGVDTVVPVIEKAVRFKPFVEDVLPKLQGHKVVAHPYAPTTFKNDKKINGLPKVLVVGAEGGFVPYEIELLANNGVMAVSFGSRILRTESAVNALLGCWV